MRPSSASKIVLLRAALAAGGRWEKMARGEFSRAARKSGGKDGPLADLLGIGRRALSRLRADFEGLP